MRTGPGGPLGAVVLLAAMTAVPMLAVFGVPQFAPVSASPGDDEFFPSDNPSAELFDANAFRDAFGSERHSNQGPLSEPSEPPFASNDRPDDPFHSTPADGSAAQPASWTPPAEALGDWRSETVAPSVPASEQEPAARPARGSVVSHGADPRSAVRANFDDRPLVPTGTPATSDAGSSAAPARPLAWAAIDRASKPESVGARHGEPSLHQSAEIDDRGDSTVRATDGLPPWAAASNPFAESDASNAPAPSPAPFSQDAEQLAAAAEVDSTARFVKDVRLRSDRSAGAADERAAFDGGRQPALTWQTAVRRLNELGIRHFQLEPGESDGFLFSCYFTPGDDPRISRRFEAEASEPLRAVEKVLAQVEQWLGQR